LCKTDRNVPTELQSFRTGGDYTAKFKGSRIITSEIINHRQMVGRMISLSQGLYPHRTTQHRQTRTSIHALSGIRTRDPVYERSRPASQTARPLDRLLTIFNMSHISQVTMILYYQQKHHLLPVALGGLVVSVLVTGPKVAGSNPAEDDGF
jgi:hypothetical protein